MKMRHLLLLSCISLMGVTSVAQAAGNYAVVNINAAIAQSKDAKAWNKKFKSQNATAINDLKALERDIQKLQNDYKKDEAVMSDDQKRKAKLKLQEKLEELQFKGKKFQAKQGQEQQEMLKTVYPKVGKALDKLMDKHKYDIIFRAEAVANASEQANITDEVIKELNK